MAEQEYNQQDWSIIPPGMSDGPINLGAGVPLDTTPDAPEMPNVEDFYPERFQTPLINPNVASTDNIHNIADNFIYNNEVDENVMKGTQVLGNFHTSEYGMNQFVDRYQEHNKFSDLGFSPFLDNETRYNEASSYWDELSRAAGQWTTLAGLGFKDAMSFGDVTDRKTAEKFKRAMDIGSSTDSGAFGTNLFLNSGYTIGIMGELIVEEVGMAAAAIGLGIAEVPTFGAATPMLAADLALMGTRASRAFGKISTAWKATKNLGKTLSSFKDMNKARQYFGKTMKATGRFLNPLENTTQFLRNKKKVAALNAGENGVTSLTKLKTATRGFAELYKDVRNARLAFGEGALEGGMVENEMINDLTKEWMAEHPGEKMTEQTSKDIQKAANDAGRLTTWTNAPVIMLSNKIVLDGILRPGQFSRKVVGDVFESGLGKKLLFNPKKTIKDAYSKLPKNWFAKKLHYIKNPRLLGGAAYTTAVKYSAANFAEGAQEIAQEIIGGTNIDYYTAKYQGDVARGGYYSNLAQNITKQVSPQGFETFASGFLMGGIAGPISNTVGKGIAGAQELFDPNSDLRIRGFKYSEKEDGTGKYFGLGKVGRAVGVATGTEEQVAKAQKLDQEREEKLNDVVKTLNEFNTDPEQYLSPELTNMIEQKELSTLMTAAEQAGDKKGYYDFKNTAGFKHVATALRYGRLGTHIKQIEEFKNFTEEEIRQSYGISKEQFDREISKSVDRAKRIEKRFNKAKELFPNPFDPKQYARNGDLRIKTSLAMLAWDNAVEEFIFNQESFDNAQTRMESILNKAKDKLNLENTPYSEFNSLFTIKQSQDGINLLKLEIEALEEGGIKKSDKSLQKKKLKLKALEEYADALEIAKADRIASETETIAEPTKKKLKKAFDKYIKVLAEENGDYVAGENLDDVFDDVLDYASLSDRRQKAMDAANTLSNPTKFQEEFQRILDIQQKLYDNKKEEIKKSLKIFIASMDENDMLQDLHKAGMFFSIEELEKLKTKNELPSTFYYTNINSKKGKELSDLEVQKNSDDYDKAIAIVKVYYPHLTGLPVPQEISNAYSSSVRAKLDNDNRTLEDIATQYGFVPGVTDSKVPLKEVLQKIIESKYATPQEKALANELLKTADDLEYVTFSNTMNVPGEYTTSGQTKIDARYSSTNYKKFNAEGRDLPIEVQILRYEIQRKVNDALSNVSEFTSNIDTLKNEVLERITAMVDNKEELDLRFIYFLQSNEAFVQGAMTDYAFQKFLSTIPSSLSTNNKNGWEVFVDSILNALKITFGKRPNGTVLNAAMDIITAEIGGEQASVKETKTESTGETETKETVSGEGPININESPQSLYKDHSDFMTSMVEEYTAQNDIRVEKDEDPLGRFEDKNGKPYTTKQILASRGFKVWWKQPFNSKKNTAISDYNIKNNKPGGSTSTASSDFTNEEVEKIRKTGIISKVRLVAIADKISRLEQLTPNEKAVLNIEAVAIQFKALADEREKINQRNSVDNNGIITIPMKNQLRDLGWNDVQINKMSVSEANTRIADGVSLSELQAQSEKQRVDENNKVSLARQKIRKDITDNFEKSTNMEELTAEYDKVVAEIQMNLDNYANTLDLKSFDVEALYEKNIERLAAELNFEDLYVGNALLTQVGGIVVIDQITDEGKVIALYQNTERAITFTKDNMRKLIKARFSKAWAAKKGGEVKGNEITEEETEISNQSIEINDNDQDFESSIDKNISPEDAKNNFLDSINKRCPK